MYICLQSRFTNSMPSLSVLDQVLGNTAPLAQASVPIRLRAKLALQPLKASLYPGVLLFWGHRAAWTPQPPNGATQKAHA